MTKEELISEYAKCYKDTPYAIKSYLEKGAYVIRQDDDTDPTKLYTTTTGNIKHVIVKNDFIGINDDVGGTNKYSITFLST